MSHFNLICSSNITDCLSKSISDAYSRDLNNPVRIPHSRQTACACRLDALLESCFWVRELGHADETDPVFISLRTSCLHLLLRGGAEWPVLEQLREGKKGARTATELKGPSDAGCVHT